MAVAEGTVLTGSSTGFNIREAFDKAMPSLREYSKDTPEPTPTKEPVKQEAKVAPVKTEVAPPEEEVIVEPETPAEEAVTTDTPEVEETQPTKEGKEGKRWGELKAIEKEHKKTLSTVSDLQKQITALNEEKAQIAQKAAEAERVRAELDEAYKELHVSRIEAHPEFRSAVTEPRNQVFGEILQIAERTKVDPKAMIDAIHKDTLGDPDALSDFLDSNVVNDRWKAKVYALSENLTQIEGREKDLRTNSKSALETLTKKQQEQMEERLRTVTAERSKAADNVSEKFKSRLGTLLPEGHDLDFDSVKVDSQKFDSLPESDKVYASYAGYALPKLVTAYENTAKELKAAKAELAKFRNGSPKASQGTTPAAQSAKKEESKPDVKKGWDSFAAESMERLKPFARK